MGKYALDFETKWKSSQGSEGQTFYSLLLQASLNIFRQTAQSEFMEEESDADYWSEHDDTLTDSESEMLMQ